MRDAGHRFGVPAQTVYESAPRTEVGGDLRVRLEAYWNWKMNPMLSTSTSVSIRLPPPKAS
jgi:hypothetical protein